jgi:pimeloyl-ACP methyl ester carboxylesterase
MATFVLVHGAWLGGWCWQRVTPHLRAAGHEVFAPTLTGLGERAHLLTRDVGLETHVLDIVNVVEFEELRDVILVGHSYGGMVVAGVAECVPERLARAVYLDAWFPIDDDRSMIDLGSRYLPGFLDPMLARAQAEGDGWLIPTPGGPEYPLPFRGDDLRWLMAHMTPHPAKTLHDQVATDNTAAVRLPHTYIVCPTPRQPPRFAPFAEQAQRNGWTCHQLAAGHFVFMTMPAELSALLTTQAAL